MRYLGRGRRKIAIMSKTSKEEDALCLFHISTRIKSEFVITLKKLLKNTLLYERL